MKKKSRVLPLKKSSLFQEVFEKGKTFSSENVLLKASFSKLAGDNVFLGYAVANHPSFSVVKKNRIKRLLKNGVYKSLSFIDRKVPSGFFVLSFVGNFTPSSQLLFKNVSSAFKKAASIPHNT